MADFIEVFPNWFHTPTTILFEFQSLKKAATIAAFYKDFISVVQVCSCYWFIEIVGRFLFRFEYALTRNSHKELLLRFLYRERWPSRP